MSNRSSEKRITRKSAILRHMRQSRGLSLNEAGRRAGITGAAIAHMEHGRMDVSDERIRTLVQAYGYTLEEFREFAEGKSIPMNYRDECILILRELDEDKLQVVYSILVHLLPGASSRINA